VPVSPRPGWWHDYAEAGMLLVVTVGISSVYDFYRSYHHAHSIVGGIGYVVFGLVLLAIFWWLYSEGRSSN
jgi:hypothetical protein